MTERMSHDDWKIRHVWLMQNAMTQDDRAAIAADCERARAREAELEAALDAATREIESLKQSRRDKEKLKPPIPDFVPKNEPSDLPRAIEQAIRRIVREEIRNARQRVTAVYPSGQRTVDNYPLDTLFWDDEEATDA